MEDLAQRPAGDVLEEIVRRGPAGYPAFVACYPSAPPSVRIAVLVGGLVLGTAAAEACREVLRTRDSKEKTSLLFGLGEIGHPEAEGYLSRILRERAAPEHMLAAVRCLGRIRGERGRPLVVEAFGREPLFAAACEALAAYGGPGAEKLLLTRGTELPALRALAALGSAPARELFLAALDREPPWPAAGANGIGSLGDPTLAPRVAALIGSEDETVARAGFEAYAALGAPDGLAPLLEAASHDLRPWMIPALGALDHPDARRFLLGLLEARPPRGFWRRLLGWRRAEPVVEPRLVYRALRGAGDFEILSVLAARLPAESDPAALRELLSCGALAADPSGAAPLLELWRDGDLFKQYLAARALLQAPTASFLSEALVLLAKPGFRGLDGGSPLVDPTSLLEGYGRDNNPFLLLGGFLDSGFGELSGLERSLAGRFRSWAFPAATPATQCFDQPADGDIGAFLSAMTAAHPGTREPLQRLWNLLAEMEDGDASLLELFLCSTGVHRGGIQRALVRGMASAVGRLIQGRNDGALRELEEVAAKIPADARCSKELKEVFGRARRALMAECRDMALIPEGPPKGDIVLVEKL